MSTTDDPADPRLANIGPDGMQETYLVLSDEERAKGFARPLFTTYVHVGPPGPIYPLRLLTAEESERHAGAGYVVFEEYLRFVPAGAPYPAADPDDILGSFWTQARLDSADKGCGTATTMSAEIAETYARSPRFYGGTYCARCRDHFPVGKDGEFLWDGTGIRVGT